MVDRAGYHLYLCLAAGQVGEVWCKGPTVFDGYWKLPEATAESFHDGWFKTGDLATLDTSGYMTVVDRKKDMVRAWESRGYVATRP